jgi:hypothetical protein
MAGMTAEPVPPAGAAISTTGELTTCLTITAIAIANGHGHG